MEYVGMKELVLSAKNELECLDRIKYISTAIGADYRKVISGAYAWRPNTEDAFLRKEILKMEEFKGSTHKVYELFLPLIKFLSFRLGNRDGLDIEIEAEGTVSVVSSLKKFDPSLAGDDFQESFVAFMNHRIRSDLMMFFLKNKDITDIPRRVLLVSVHYHRALSLNHKMTGEELEAYLLGESYTSEPQFKNWCRRNKLGIDITTEELRLNYKGALSKIEKSDMSKSEKNELKSCQAKIGNMTKWKQKGPEATIEIIRKARLVEQSSTEDIYENRLGSEDNILNLICFKEMIKHIKGKFDEKSFEYWIKRKMGFSGPDMIAHKKSDGGHVSLAEISRRVKIIDKWVEKNGREYMEGDINDTAIEHYLKAGGIAAAA